MQAELLDSTTSCIPSTLNFVCDVDGVQTEISIPSSAWDVESETVWLTQAQLAELYKPLFQTSATTLEASEIITQTGMWHVVWDLRPLPLVATSA